MIAQPVTINLPKSIYERLKQRAEQAHTTIEDELLQVVAAGVPESNELAPELKQLLKQMTMLDDDELWRAARESIPTASVNRLEELNFKLQREGLTPVETQEANAYLRQYERTMLTRAQAASLLIQRGFDVSKMYDSP